MLSAEIRARLFSRRAAFCLALVLLAHLGLGWSLLNYEANEILAAGQSDAVVRIQLATVAEPAAPPPVPAKPTIPAKERALASVKPKPVSPKLEPTVPQTKGDLPDSAGPSSEASQNEAAKANAGGEPGGTEPASTSNGERESTVIAAAPGLDKSGGPSASGASPGATASSTVSAPRQDAGGAQASTDSPPPKEVPAEKPSAESRDAAGNPVKPLTQLYSQPLASFPKPLRMTFAVHAPKDFDESSATGVAELRSDSVLGEGGAMRFELDLEVKLGWLLSKMIGGSLRYQSQGQIGPNGPQTRRYAEKVGDRPERWLEVDRDKRLMKSHQIASLALEPGTQDRLSVMWLLSMLARTDPGVLDKGKIFTVPMFTFRQIYPARFESYGQEVLLAPAGPLQTLHVGYKSQDQGGDKFDVWLGYDYEMQPVRIRWQEAQGRVIDMILQKKPL
jgi:hypothetical protein